jgi:predicted DNA binding CopG/RHH family protein
MEQRLAIPKFENEADEAKWWFQNQDSLFDEFEQAGREGRLGRGTVARRANASSTTIILDPQDAERARAQAARQGLEYQAYVKMVVHKALLNAEQNA